MNGKDALANSEEEILDFEKYELRDEQLKVVADNLKLGLVLHDIIYDEEGNPIDCRFKYINGIYEKITHRTKLELEGNLLSEAIASGNQGWIEKYKVAIINNQVVSFDNYDGILKKWFNITAYSPNPTRLALLLTDISKRKNAEAALMKSEEENRIIINNLQVGIIVYDGEGKVILYNEETPKMFKQPLEHIIGGNLDHPNYNYFHEDGDTPMKFEEFPVKIVMRTRKPLLDYVIGVVKKGEEQLIWLKCNATPVFNNNSIDKIIVSFADITNQRELEAKIVEDAKELFNQKVQAEATLVSIGDGVIATDTKGIIRVFNAVAEQLTGWSKKEAIGYSFEKVFNIIKANTRKKHENIVMKVLTTNKSVDLHGDNILLSRSGKEYYIEDSATPIKTNDNGIIGVVLVFRDITDKVLLSNKLNMQSQRLSQVVDVAVDMIFELDKEKKVTYYSGYGFDKLGYGKTQIIGKKIDSIFRDNLAIQNLAFLRAMSGSPYSYDCNLERGNQSLWYEMTLSPLYEDDKKKIIGVLGVCRDITERKRGQEEIEYLSKHDFLTGLHNRHYFVNEMERLDVEANHPLGVLMADLNGLKIFNDVYGHDIGDNALQAASQVLKNVVGKEDVLARIGGDEFAMIFPRTTKEKMVEIYNHIRKETAQNEINRLPLSLAIGYEIKNNNYVNIHDALKIAENRMYRLKLTDSMRFRNDAVKKIMEELNNRHLQLKINSEIVSDLCRKMGEVLNLKEDAILELEQTGLLHNIGKIFISDEIIRKPSKLTADEYQIVKLHSEKGYQILKVADRFSHLADYVLYHHEAWDGTGYPRGLKGNDIPLVSRIIHMVDSYEAMTSPRPYRQSMTYKEAAQELIKCAGKQFDPRITKIFVEKVLGFELDKL